jgi:NTP pyrophosphatase (non-canonical NTP hydrolase)
MEVGMSGYALNELDMLVRHWAEARNLISGATSQAQTVKLFEEGGEVAHAVACGDRDALKDGIGDMMVVLIILAAQNGLTLRDCLSAAYDEIKDRKGRMVDGIFVKDVG